MSETVNMLPFENRFQLEDWMKENNVRHVFSFLETTPTTVERFLALPQIGIAYDMVWVARHYSRLGDLEYFQHTGGHISMAFKDNHWLYTV